MSANLDGIRQEAVQKRRVDLQLTLESRKRKLSELYAVSNLSKIRTVNTPDSLKEVKDSLSFFIQKNDLSNGKRFNIQSLNELKDQPTIEEAPSKAEPEASKLSDDKNSPSQHQKIPSQDSLTSASSNQAQPNTAGATTGLKNSNNLSQVQIEVPRLEPSIVPNEATPTSTGQQLNSLTKQKSAQDLMPTDSQKLESANKQVSQFQSQPITQTPSQESRDVLPSNLSASHKRKAPNGYLSLFDAENRDVSDTLVLVLKESLPPKVVESTPLAELYYLAQTLPLVKLMPATHKAVTSTMFESALTEGKINVVHSRIEELKRQGKWSLRQPSRFIDPIKHNFRTHWDNLLSEMNWMAIDFREERKLKLATCAYIAQSIMDFWAYGKVCCVKRKPIAHLDQLNEPAEVDAGGVDIDMTDANDNSSELQSNEKSEVTDDDAAESINISKLLQRPKPEDEVAPYILPQISVSDYMKVRQEKENQSPFKLLIDSNDLNHSDRTLLEHLPAFSSFQAFDERFTEAPLVPVSKSLLPAEDDGWYNLQFKQVLDDTDIIPDQQKGLFGFSSQKKISTSIKPPQPPNLKYLDLRTPTIWLPEDDQDLIEYVNQFSFNWGVVSAHLSKRPSRSYSSNIERRTPWQCFERYIQLNDTFQINDMRGQNTLSAMKWLEHAHNIQATTKRRISPLGVGIDSIQRGHKRLRWASMFEAVRKCMRKRESVTRPNNNQTRRGLDDKKIVAPTPAELSKLKYERDKAIQEAYLQNPANGFRGRPIANGASTRGTANQSNRGTSQTPLPGNAQLSDVPPSGAQAPRFDNVAVGAQNVQQQIQQQSRPVTGQPPKLAGPNGQPYTPEQLRQLMQLRQRKLLQQQQHQQELSQANTSRGSPSPVSAKAVPAQGANNQNYDQTVSSRSNSNTNVVSQSSSPVVGQSQISNNQGSSQSGSNNGRKLSFIPAHVSAIISQIQSQNPNMSKQEVTKIAAQYLATLQAKQNNQVRVANGGSPQLPTTTHSAKTTPVPTPQQILQQSVTAPTANRANSKVDGMQQLSQNGQGVVLTTQQRQQLEMLRTIQEQEQKKRNEASVGTPSSGNNDTKQ